MKTSQQLAEEHVDWLLKLLNKILRELLIEEFKHGYKHGKEDNNSNTK